MPKVGILFLTPVLAVAQVQLINPSLPAIPAMAWADNAVPVSSPRLVYATYADASGSVVRGFAVDPSGYAYLAGSRPGSGSSSCAFLTKLNQAGTAAVWSVCVPVGEVEDIAVDASGYIYVVGSVPTTIMKLSPDV